jgi:hypothetical protein
MLLDTLEGVYNFNLPRISMDPPFKRRPLGLGVGSRGDWANIFNLRSRWTESINL